ncbi:MAG: hypothetical protein Q9181_004548 [Wetmoreana brouardii]
MATKPDVLPDPVKTPSPYLMASSRIGAKLQSRTLEQIRHQPKQSCPSHSAAEAGIGVGVGVPLALGLGAALFLLSREKRRGQERLTEQQRGKPAEFRHEIHLLIRSVVFLAQQQHAAEQKRYRQDVAEFHEADSTPFNNVHEAPP